MGNEIDFKDTIAWIDQFVDLSKLPVSHLNTPIQIPLKPTYLLTFSDNELVSELRSRGYEVKATKTIEL